MRIAVVDDHDLVREGLNSLLGKRDNYEIIQFATGSELLNITAEGSRYDIYVIDLELPDIDGFELIDRLRTSDSGAPILVSTIHDEIWTLRKLLTRDVNAIIYKSADSSEILTAIDEILCGNRYYCEEVRKAITTVAETYDYPSAREMQVLGLIAQGKTTKEIASEMFISDNTVEAHRKSLFTKLGAVNVADLIYKAVEKGFFIR